jgi:hypothetical protein
MLFGGSGFSFFALLGSLHCLAAFFTENHRSFAVLCAA